MCSRRCNCLCVTPTLSFQPVFNASVTDTDTHVCHVTSSLRLVSRRRRTRCSYRKSMKSILQLTSYKPTRKLPTDRSSSHSSSAKKVPLHMSTQLSVQHVVYAHVNRNQDQNGIPVFFSYLPCLYIRIVELTCPVFFFIELAAISKSVDVIGELKLNVTMSNI